MFDAGLVTMFDDVGFSVVPEDAFLLVSNSSGSLLVAVTSLEKKKKTRGREGTASRSLRFWKNEIGAFHVALLSGERIP